MRHLLRRVGFYLVAFWAAITINFFIPRLIPGDPIMAMIAQMQGQVTQSTIDALRAQFGIGTDPLWIQYFQYLGNLFHGELGVSISEFGQPVSTLIGEHLQWTIGLVGVSSIISFTLGTLLGVIFAWRRGGWADTGLLPLMTFISAIPYFWLALGLLYTLGALLHWFPVSGGYDVLNVEPDGSWTFISDMLWHATLPAITIVLGSIAGWVLSMRNTMLTTLSEDYVLMAEAKGLSNTRVMLSYAARNAILPSITGFAMSLGFIVAGSLLTEIVFSYPGIGNLLFKAVVRLDYALIEGIFMFIALAVLIANFAADVIYLVLDPRVRQEKG